MVQENRSRRHDHIRWKRFRRVFCVGTRTEGAIWASWRHAPPRDLHADRTLNSSCAMYVGELSRQRSELRRCRWNTAHPADKREPGKTCRQGKPTAAIGGNAGCRPQTTNRIRTPCLSLSLSLPVSPALEYFPVPSQLLLTPNVS